MASPARPRVHVGHTTKLDGQVEVGDEAPHDDALLRILLAEEDAGVGHDHGEELGDDGGDAQKWAGPRTAPSSVSVIGPSIRTVVTKPSG